MAKSIGVKLISAPVEKAETPTQIYNDDKAYANDWPTPPLGLDGLAEMVSNSSILPQCIRAYSSNIAGYGLGIKYKDDDQEETPEAKAEWEMLEDLLNLFSIEQDTKEIFEDIIEAREKYGIAYLEVLRNRKGEVTQIQHVKETEHMRKSIPLLPMVEEIYFYKGKEVRRKKKFRKYKQEIGGTTVYFKEFGDPRQMDYRTGEYTERVEFKYQANEILDFTIGTDTYGQVRWVGQIMGCDGARRAEGLNNNYFINGRHTPVAFVVQGGTLSKQSEANLKAYMDGIRGEKGQHSFLLLEAENTDSDFDAKTPTVEIKDLASILQKDELFQEYIDNNRRRVQSSFNLPDLYVGYTTDFNRATAQTAMEVTEKQVFQPERKSLAWVINNRLLNGYQLKYCEVEFLEPDITNPDDLYKILTVTEKAGGLPPNKAKQIAYDAIGETADDYDADWGEIPVTIQNLQANAMNSLMNLAGSRTEPAKNEEIEEETEKLEEEKADETIAVMKATYKLLKKMQKEG